MIRFTAILATVVMASVAWGQIPDGPDAYKELHRQIAKEHGARVIAAIETLKEEQVFFLGDQATGKMGFIKMWKPYISGDIEGWYRLVGGSIPEVKKLMEQRRSIKEHVFGEEPPYDVRLADLPAVMAAPAPVLAAEPFSPITPLWVALMDQIAAEKGKKLITALEEVIRLSGDLRSVANDLKYFGLPETSPHVKRFADGGIPVNVAKTTDFRQRNIPRIRKLIKPHPHTGK